MSSGRQQSHRKRRKPNWEILIPAIPFTLFALYMSYGFYLSYQDQQGASADFLPVSATILSSQVESSLHSNQTGSATHVYTPRIIYRYEVNGQTWQSKHFSFLSRGLNSREHAQNIVDRYPVGATKTAYYNPNNPAEAVLNKARPGAWWKHFWFPAIFLTAGFFALFAGLRGWKLRPE